MKINKWLIAIVVLLILMVESKISYAEEHPGSIIEEKQKDYQNKLNLYTEQGDRINEWYNLYKEKEEIAEENIIYLGLLTTNYIKKADDVIETGKEYKMAMFENKEGFAKEALLSLIKIVEQNEKKIEQSKIDVTNNYDFVKKNKRVFKGITEEANREIEKTIKELEEKERINKTKNNKSITGFEAFMSITIILAYFVYSSFTKKRW